MQGTSLIDVNRSVFYILLKVSIKPTKEKQEKLTFYNVSLYCPAKKFVGKKVTNFCLGDEYLLPTKFFADEIFYRRIFYR